MEKINFGDIKKVILFGGGLFLLEATRQLKKDGYEIVVFSALRHLKEEWEGNSLEKLLRESAIEFYESKDINTDEQVTNHISAQTLGLSLGAAWIFKKEFIESFNGKLLNIHGTRLPQNRGGGGFSWQIMRQDRLGCFLVHQVSPGIDTGNIVTYKEFIYPASCRIPLDYSDYQFQEYTNCFEGFISQIKAKNDFKLVGQPEYLSTYWPRLNTAIHGFIDWSWPLKHIEAFINAFDDPYSGAATFINGKKVSLKGCHVDYNDGAFHPFQQGLIYRKMEDAIFISANEGTLIVTKVINEEGKNIRDEFRLGERVFTPMSYLENAKLFKAVYTPSGLKEGKNEGITENVMCPPLKS